MSPTREALFWAKVNKTDDCWEWTASGTHGYGLFWDGERTVPAHRYSYELAFGPIPDGELVCHRCDNRACVRPDHFFLGSYKDNYDDSRRKGRHTHGERVSNSKLTEAQVAEVRGLLEQGFSKADIGRRFGVTRTAVYWIAVGRNWSRAVERGETGEAA